MKHEDQDRPPSGARRDSAARRGRAPNRRGGVDDQPPVEHVRRRRRSRPARARRAAMKNGGPSGWLGPKPGMFQVASNARPNSVITWSISTTKPQKIERVHDPGRLLAGQELPLAEPVDDSASDPLGDPVKAPRRPRSQQQPCPDDDDPRRTPQAAIAHRIGKARWLTEATPHLEASWRSPPLRRAFRRGMVPGCAAPC